MSSNGAVKMVTLHDCHNLNDGKSDNEGNTTKTAAGGEIWRGGRRAGGQDGVIVQRLQGKDNRRTERRSEAGEDLLFTALRENKRAAGLPNHRQINETHFKSQTKVLRLLHASVLLSVPAAHTHTHTK